MRSQQFNVSLVRVVVRGLLALILFAGFAVTPADRQVYSGGRAASAQSDDPSLVWKKPEEVKRAPQNYQKKVSRPKPKTESKPLLALRLWALKRDQSLNPVETSLNATFHVGDRLQLAMQPNQDGYLYLVQESERPGDQPVLFPDSRINDGQNYVKQEQRLVIPSNCRKEYNDERGNCWWQVTKQSDRLTIIFSRAMLLNLPDKLAPTASVAKVNSRALSTIKKSANQKLAQAELDDRYTVQFWNTNRNNNEILIAEIVIKHEQ